MGIQIIIRRNDRMVRERLAEAPRWAQRETTGYARGLEEAYRIQGERGRDNPNAGMMVVDDVDAARSTRRRNRQVIKSVTGVDIGE